MPPIRREEKQSSQPSIINLSRSSIHSFLSSLVGAIFRSFVLPLPIGQQFSWLVRAAAIGRRVSLAIWDEESFRIFI